MEDSALPGPHLSSHPSRILTTNTTVLVCRTRDMGEGWEPYTGSLVGTAWASPRRIVTHSAQGPWKPFRDSGKAMKQGNKRHPCRDAWRETWARET